jgi:short-subunit dehydrogenase
MPTSRPLALVTGASSGIGRALAGLLARDGHDLIVVARRRERLEALAAELGTEIGAQVEVVVADLTETADVARLAERVAPEPRLSLLVNNAGFPGYGSFAEIDADVMRRSIAIHVTTPATLIRAALPGMIARGAGAVVNVSSLLSLSGPLRIGMAGRATYAGAKSFQLVFIQSLAAELEGTGVRAMVCLPGMVESEFHGPGLLAGRPGAPPLMSSEDCARAIVAGLALGEVVCVPASDDAPAIFEQLRDLQQATLAGGNRTGRLAARYAGGDEGGGAGGGERGGERGDEGGGAGGGKRGISAG